MISCLLLWLKSWNARGASHHPAFIGNCPTISHTFFSLTYPVYEFYLKEMRTWGQPKISSNCFCVCCESRELGGFLVWQQWWKPSTETESHLEFRQTSTTELLCEDSQSLNMLTVSPKMLHRRLPTRLKTRIRLEVL